MRWLNRFTRRVTEFWSTVGSVVTKVTVLPIQRSRFSTKPTQSWARSDYDYWRRAYWCQVKGLEISGLFIRPIVQKISAWTLGRPPQWAMEDLESVQALTEWWSTHHFSVIEAYTEALKQGDVFLIINPDLTISAVQPELVDPIVDEQDYSRIVGWRVTQVFSHPIRVNDRMKVVDEFYVDRRVRIVERDPDLRQVTTFPNLIGILPVIHISNQPQAGQVFGNAECRALVEILQRYNITLEAAVDGNERQGRPTPVVKFETRADLEKFWDDYGETETRELPDGTTENNAVISVDLSQILTISAAEFEYAAPGNFTEDTERLLSLMFYLLLEHAQIPEFVFGNAVASSKASTETQLPIFETFIIMRQGEIKGWLSKMAQVVLAYMSLVQPGIVVEVPPIQWRKLSKNGKLTLDTLVWAYEEGLIDRRTALSLAPVEVENIDNVLENAIREKEERDKKAQEQAVALRAAAPAPSPAQEMSPELYDQLVEIGKVKFEGNGYHAS